MTTTPSTAPAAHASPNRRGVAETGERRIIVLGSTGSIGTQTLDVVRHLNALHARGEYPHRFRVVGLGAGRSADALAEQAREFGVRDLAMGDREAAGRLPVGTPAPLTGADAAERLVRSVDADIVLAAMVGSAGLPATLAAVELRRDVALANKETLVAAGALVVPAAQRSGARLLPVDSEHSALWQSLQGIGSLAREMGKASDAFPCPPCPPPACVSRLILTASGGPFRTRTREEIANATAADALKHPTWSMGPKVTIDTASLTNKALEVLEAHWLFGMPGERIGVLIHPQSIVHSLVEYADGSLIAQLGAPDMRQPIQYALTFPDRPPGVSRKLDLATLAKLEFAEPDLGRFPALGLAWRVIAEGGTSGAVFNAANEAAVHALIDGKIRFGRVPELTREAMDALGHSPLRTLGDALDADRRAREFVASRIG